MASAATVYVRDVYDRFKLTANWMPNANVALGDVGFIVDGVFHRETSLDKMKLTFGVRQGISAGSFTFTSESGVKIRTKLKGEIAPQTSLPSAKAGVAIQFSKRGGGIFQASECYIDEIDGKAILGAHIKELFEADSWDRDWGVIDTLVRAGSTTIIVSNSEQAMLELTTKAAIDAASLSKLDAGFSVNAQRGDIFRFVSERGLTPLFKLSRIKPSFLGIVGIPRKIRFGGVQQTEPDEADNIFEVIEPPAY